MTDKNQTTKRTALISPDPRVKITASGDGNGHDLTFSYSESTGWSPAGLQEITIGGKVTLEVADGTPYNAGSMSRPLSSGSTVFTTGGVENEILHFTLEMTDAELVRIKAENSDLYLNVDKNGNVVQNSYSSKDPSFGWKFTPMTGGTFRIRNASVSGILYAPSVASATNLVVGDPDEGVGVQEWLIGKNGYIITPEQPNLVWDVRGASTSPGGNIEIYVYNGNSNQHFRLSAEPS